MRHAACLALNPIMVDGSGRSISLHGDGLGLKLIDDNTAAS